ncbi:MAG TPA: DUF3800 domain-containing protein [Verrucomicrobiae bacterium]|jgi:hypothetical protein
MNEKKPELSAPQIKHYFVDEAGDPILFDAKGRVLPGTEGCSRYFIVGLLDVADASKLAKDLHDLRAKLLADPYFKGVPSMQPDEKKTALYFHAKDDLPEVRREVFALLQRHELKFSAVVRDKRAVLDYVRSRNERGTAYRYKPDDLYDHAVRRLFKERLHKHQGYTICFAIRGNSHRTAAFRTALETARARFAQQRNIALAGPLDVKAARPTDEPALQAVDYFLWALQRTYERREDRYLTLLWSQCSLVIDVDDTREAEYGAYYTKQKPLTAAALKNG